ncbi:M14 family zinc carboxypeptidase [Alkalimarinus alittae]|uniref:DUF2817 domain-containing protein n=1 Tax=Alkalimarinus alittae TaxID=2961619 RepID=A0ABY6MXI3_9ALTE|nr:M14 family zinc carboxypeptidase [Alkalimarinus alittae]UZE94544.1 DUF2817 domain-containing protein [Alkalimarinus alittae]
MFTRTLRECLPELVQLERFIARARFKVNHESSVAFKDLSLPIYSVEVMPFKAGLPTVIFTGGIHGIERIGTQVLLAYMDMLSTKLSWDAGLQHQLSVLNIIFIPIVNPGGMYLNRRANPKGVDLMRNAPIEAETQPPLLGGGQRLSSKLPWYCGNTVYGLEQESQTLMDIVERYAQQSPFTISTDCHSGFGLRDHLWFPYAYRKRPIAALDKLYALKLLLDKTYPHHDYVFEPQSLSYITHGDLWDYIYKRHKNNNESVLLPLTLEMGSWNWVKKHPIQLLSFAGLFNPIVPHRQRRVLRRHLMLFDFICSAAIAHKKWIPKKKQKQRMFQAAEQFWYRASP